MKRVWLVEARKQKEMSQAKVAHAIGVAPVTYGKYEAGDRTPSPDIATAIGAILNVPREKFFWP